MRRILTKISLKKINLADIMDSTFANYEVYKSQLSPKLKSEKVATLKGDFSPTQAKRFFEKYDLLKHQHNTNSGFSATLFGEKRKQTNTESKEVSYTSDYGYTNYILAIRGTESRSVA